MEDTRHRNLAFRALVMGEVIGICGVLFVCFGVFFFSCLFRAAPMAYASSQARGRIGAAAASLSHSHNNTRSQPSLQPTLLAMLDPCPGSSAGDQTCILMDASQVLNLLSTMETPLQPLIYFSWLSTCATYPGFLLLFSIFIAKVSQTEISSSPQ